mmetsp:Transcript_358/g.494  ORF Transcript_358/g.494 Transcript_358/m.494 type:complete len:257 (-) Transcript_358:87-857(-)
MFATVLFPSRKAQGGSTIATSSDFLGTKRRYLADKKTFYNYKNLTLQAVKASMVPMLRISNEFNAHLMENAEDPDAVATFDYSASLKRNLRIFWPALYRCMSTSYIKSILVEISLNFFTLKMVDKLTKDVSASVVRKLARDTSRLMVCSKIFFTAVWGNVLFNVSAFLYDSGLYLVTGSRGDDCSEEEAKKERSRSLVAKVQYLGKKSVFYTVCCFSSGLGTSIGAFVGGSTGAIVGDYALSMVGPVTCAFLLGMP